MAFLIVWALLGCGESVTFEEPAEPEAPEEAVEDDLPADDFDPVNVPEDGRDEIEARSEAQAPPSRDVWPPVVIPQDAREREWKWDFQHKGTSDKFETRGEPSREEMNAIEFESEPGGRAPDEDYD